MTQSGKNNGMKDSFGRKIVRGGKIRGFAGCCSLGNPCPRTAARHRLPGGRNVSPAPRTVPNSVADTADARLLTIAGDVRKQWAYRGRAAREGGLFRQQLQQNTGGGHGVSQRAVVAAGCGVYIFGHRLQLMVRKMFIL